MDRAGDHGVALVVVESPDLASVNGAESCDHPAAWADDLGLPFDFNGQWRGEGKFAFCIRGAGCFPACLTCGFVERNDAGVLTAIGTEDEEIADDDRAASIAVYGFVLVLTILPKDRSILRIEASGSLMPKVHVDLPILPYGRGAGVAVLLVNPRGRC